MHDATQVKGTSDWFSVDGGSAEAQAVQRMGYAVPATRIVPPPLVYRREQRVGSADGGHTEGYHLPLPLAPF